MALNYRDIIYELRDKRDLANELLSYFAVYGNGSQTFTVTLFRTPGEIFLKLEAKFAR